MKRDDLVHLQHILGAIAKVEAYLQGKDKGLFEQDPLLQDGVIRQIEVIGEATKRLSKELRNKF
ncbi:MAG: HepT-like ribonuclease domain-containing protein [Anaerolineae bacterium]